MKDNKLIAEFMGAEGYPKYDPIEWDIYITGCLDVDSDNENAQHFFTPNQMKYHSSWDWLMPVVEKCLIGEAEQDEEISNTTIKNIYEGICNQDISYAYRSVVEFIKKLKEN
jgi:hypothetical protein